MTCEVAVMNTRGIALAADSAVTLGDGEKTYHNAEKLLQLVPGAPVAIMIFGALPHQKCSLPLSCCLM